MNTLLENLYNYRTLSKEDAKQILTDIVSNKYNTSQIASFLTIINMRKITLEELKGFRASLLELCQHVDLRTYNAMDVCGTGGDGKDTFNISTLSAFVLAGAGIPVAKHGNYGISSVSGSSDVLEKSGVKFHTEQSKIEAQIETANICFLHAPLFHPSLKHVAPIRKDLKVRTFFNMLGPLVNPSKPKVQMVGVYNLEIARLYHYIFQEEEAMQYSIVHSLGGYDEISLTDSCKIIGHQKEYFADANYFGFEKLSSKDLFGGNTAEEALRIFHQIILGKGNEEQNQVVLANAAIAIQTYYPTISIEDAIEKAKDSLLGGKAQKSLEKLKQIV